MSSGARARWAKATRSGQCCVAQFAHYYMWRAPQFGAEYRQRVPVEELRRSEAKILSQFRFEVLPTCVTAVSVCDSPEEPRGARMRGTHSRCQAVVLFSQRPLLCAPGRRVLRHHPAAVVDPDPDSFLEVFSKVVDRVT